MGNEISKSDWKHFNVVKEKALERLCLRILDKVCKTVADETLTAHQRYQSVYKIIMDSDEDVARGFDFHSRSRVILQLQSMQSMNLVDDQDLVGFSENVRRQLARFAD